MMRFEAMRRPIVFWVLLGLGAWLMGCGESGPSKPVPTRPAPTAVKNDADEAERLIKPGAKLGLRAEVVALSDRLSIDSARLGKTARASRLAWLAARLRERIWRFEQKSTDAREAIELYSAVVAAGVDGRLSCLSDLRQARLRGQLARDGAETYRAAYLAHARQSAPRMNADAACLEQLETMLADTEALRPRGEAWARLKETGRRHAEAQTDRLEGPVLTPATGTSSARAPAIPAAKLLGPEGEQEVVVKPSPKMLARGAVKLTGINPYSYRRGGRVVLTLSGAATYDVGVLKPDSASGKGHRIYLDLHGVRPKGVKRSIDAKGLIEQVRVGARKTGTRVVLDLSDAAFRRVFYLPDPFRVVIDLSTRKPTRAAETVKDGTRVVRRVVIDPGHGGWDAGAVGPTGLEEKDVVLDVAHRAAPALASELGIETMLTRDTDVFVPLEERTARANAYHADLFVSVHCNATENGEAHGVQIFVLDPSREMDAAALRVAARENATHASAKHSGHKHGRIHSPVQLDAQVARIAEGLSVGDSTARSRLFADLLRQSTLSSLSTRYPGTYDHGVRTAGFFVLLGADMPSVLYETAFISNPDDEKRLGTADYRQKLADSIVNAVRAYRRGRSK